MRRLCVLDFGMIIDVIRRATTVVARKACHSAIDADLAFVKTTADAVEMLRNHVALAVLDHAKTTRHMLAPTTRRAWDRPSRRDDWMATRCGGCTCRTSAYQ